MSNSDDESKHPASSLSSCSGEDPPQRRTPPPKDEGRPCPDGEGEKKEVVGGKEAGGGGERRRRRGGANNHLVGTTTLIPYGGRVEVGTIAGVTTRKSGVVWVKYPNHPNTYDVQRHHLFGTAEAAEVHIQTVRKGKSPTTNNPPMKHANSWTNAEENPQPERSTPTNPPKPPTVT